ncbi:hypothetical protein [Sulfurimonas microaerophilic]|uniref:hypothetical protein n=1 Tax=Sulfurimonas microaerophilic TaxID=3058392 RepID=UPI002714B6C1|nr:hypothetical protein [Sulfurimonas sp. hsl 1-7]
MFEKYTKILEVTLEIIKFLFNDVFLYVHRIKTSHLENLHNEIKKDTPNICILQKEFYSAYHLILDADEIINLSKDTKCFRVIQYMKKFPEILIYKNGKLSYFKKNQREIHKISDKLWNITLVSLVSCVVLIFILSPFYQALIIMFAIMTYILAMERYRLDYKKLDNLIESYNTEK